MSLLVLLQFLFYQTVLWYYDGQTKKKNSSNDTKKAKSTDMWIVNECHI